MSQVLHFLDFGLSAKAVKKWRNQPLRETYSEAHPGLNYGAPLFLDSGGFKLLFNSQLDLSEYGFPPDTMLAERIVKMQQDLGGDLIATLDYPLPPNLDRSEARERMRKSRRNAVAAAKYLHKVPTYNPFLYVAVHGQTGEDIRCYVEQVFVERRENGLADTPFGIAIGSLVPLRGRRKYEKIVELVKGAIAGIPEEHHASTPVHVFGVSGTMIPLLVYLGVDTFDSSTYAQQARTLRYYEPENHRSHPVLEMDGLDCNCRVCRDLDFDDLHRILTQGRSWRPKAGDKYKSEYYAAIALHNLEMDIQIVNRARSAVEGDAMVDFLLDYAAKFPDLTGALEKLAEDDDVLRPRLRKVTISVKQAQTASPSPYQPELFPTEQSSISLRFTPDSFRIPETYVPPAGKSVLLIIPCSGEKPYSISRTHKFLMTRLRERFGAKADSIHKITLSGLYGPVPEGYEEEEPVMRYEFRLVPQNKSQTALCVQRTTHFLREHGSRYEGVFGYATSLAYRSVLQEVSQRYKDLIVYPIHPKQRKLTEFFRNTNVEELLEALEPILTDHGNSQCS
jgi:tRNA-guanine family transglycosylase